MNVLNVYIALILLCTVHSEPTSKRYGTTRYTIHFDDKNWYQANSTCQDNGGYLVRIPNKETQQIIDDLATNGHNFTNGHNLPANGFWIGLYQNANGKQFQWISETDVQACSMASISGIIKWDCFPKHDTNKHGDLEEVCYSQGCCYNSSISCATGCPWCFAQGAPGSGNSRLVSLAVDGNYTNWGQDQPQNHVSRLCVHIKNTNGNWKWETTSCQSGGGNEDYTGIGFICQQDNAFPLTSTVHNTEVYTKEDSATSTSKQISPSTAVYATRQPTQPKNNTVTSTSTQGSPSVHPDVSTSPTSRNVTSASTNKTPIAPQSTGKPEFMTLLTTKKDNVASLKDTMSFTFTYLETISTTTNGVSTTQKMAAPSASLRDHTSDGYSVTSTAVVVEEVKTDHGEKTTRTMETTLSHVTSTQKQSSISLPMVIGLSAGSGVALIVVVVLAIVCCRCKRNKDNLNRHLIVGKLTSSSEFLEVPDATLNPLYEKSELNYVIPGVGVKQYTGRALNDKLPNEHDFRGRPLTQESSLSYPSTRSSVCPGFNEISSEVSHTSQTSVDVRFSLNTEVILETEDTYPYSYANTVCSEKVGRSSEIVPVSQGYEEVIMSVENSTESTEGNQYYEPDSKQLGQDYDQPEMLENHLYGLSH